MDREIETTVPRNGASLDVIEEEKGVYLVKQIVLPQAPTQPVKGVIDFSYSFGPLTLSGTVNTSTLAISANVSILGINLGSFNGNLKDGLVIKVDLVAVKGEVRLFLKNGNELWIALKLSVVFDGTYETEAKIITIPI